jgi:hypothetical protein
MSEFIRYTPEDIADFLNLPKAQVADLARYLDFYHQYFTNYQQGNHPEATRAMAKASQAGQRISAATPKNLESAVEQYFDLDALFSPQKAGAVIK